MNAPDAAGCAPAPALERSLTELAAAVDCPLTAAQRERLLAYARLVERWNQHLNLVGPMTLDELVRRHLVDCLTLRPLIIGPRVLDVGSGAGLPGVALAIAAPGLAVTVLDSRARRGRFLDQVRIELGLENLAVVVARVQDYTPALPFDDIVCRAYGSIADFCADTAHLCSPSGRRLLMKGRRPDAELAALDLGAAAIEVHPLQVPGWRERHVVVVGNQDPAASAAVT